MKPSAVPVTNDNQGRPNAGANDVTLAKARPGQTYTVITIAGGCEVRHRLASLGVVPGQSLEIMQPGRFGPVMIAIKGSRLALGHGVSRKVILRPVHLPKESRTHGS